MVLEKRISEGGGKISASCGYFRTKKRIISKNFSTFTEIFVKNPNSKTFITT